MWPNQQVPQRYGIVLDDTELRQAEVALGDGETRFQQLATALPSVIYAIVEDLKGSVYFEYLSPAFEVLHEVPLAEAFRDARIVAEQIHPDDRECYRQAMQQSIDTMQPFKHEWRIITPSGLVKWVQANSQPQRRQNQIVWHGVIQDVTDRKAVEAALIESDARFRQLAETVREGFFVFETATSHYSYLNPAIIHHTGIPIPPSPEEEKAWRGMTHWINNIHPDDRERIKQALKQESQGQIFNEEYRFIRPNGEIRWLQSKAFPLQDQTGNVVRIVGTVEDIHDRKRLEPTLQSSEAKLSKLLNSAGASIASFRLFPDLHCEYEYWSAGCEMVFGYTAQEFLAEPNLWINRVFPEDIEQGRIIDLKSLMKDHQTTAQGEYRFFHKDGSLRWASFQATSCPDTNWGWMITVVDIDITDRKQSEEALRESEEQFRRAFDDAPFGISLVSLTGQFLRANTFYCDLVGYTEAELTKLTVQEITHPADREAEIEGFRQMRMGEIRSFQMQKRYISRSGTVIPTIMKTAPIRDENDEILYFVGHIQDIRDRLKVERMKDEFISIISHELRTPLTSIRGALGVLGSGIFNNRPEKAEHMLQIAINNSDRLVRLINDILDLERLESGKVPLVMQPCQAADLIQQAMDSVQAIADQAGITLVHSALAEPLWVAPDAIVQALTNLLSNAIKFSPVDSTVWVRAELYTATESGNDGSQELVGKAIGSTPSFPTLPLYILFSVEDQGRGIPADKLDIIFEQFQQVDISDSRQKGGTGLGLAICKTIVQQHGGKIWVDSTLNQGSKFYFTLPFVTGSEQ